MTDYINSESNHGLKNLLDNTLAAGNCEEALLLVDNSQHNQYFEDGCAWDLIPVVSKYINEETIDKLPDLVHCCEVLLTNISKRAHPEESLLEFIELIEQVECLENNVLFTALLKPTQTCLKRKVQRGNFLLFCLNAIEYHIVNQSVPESILTQEEGNEDLTDIDPSCKVITELYAATRKFYEPFVYEITFKIKMLSDPVDISHIQNERKSLICFLLQLLGKPLASFNMSGDNPKTTARVIAENLVYDLTSLCTNLLMFLEYAEVREIQERRNFVENPSLGEDCYDMFLLENKVPTFSLGVLYYLIYGEGVTLDRVPCIYSSFYLLQMSLYLSTKLLQESECHIIKKGLKLADTVLCRVQDFDIPSRTLESPTNEHFVQVLAFTIIYCPFAELRHLSLKVFKSFIFKFDQQGRYLLMCNIHRGINHAGLLGFLITELKEIINSAMSIHPIPSSFCGKRLFSLLKLYCTLPDVAVKNLLDVSAQITASLNLLRFIIIKDKKNITGIWDSLDYFEKFLFEPLRTAIDLSRESSKVELQSVLNKKDRPASMPKEVKKSGINMSVTIGGKEIPTPNSDESTAQQIHDSLNVLDMMASLLFRLKECIQYGSLDK